MNPNRLVLPAVLALALTFTSATALADITGNVSNGPPSAGIVGFTYSGTIDNSTLAGVQAGAKFGGTFTYDASLSNHGNPGVFVFSQLALAHSISVGAGAFADQSISSIDPSSPDDQFTIQTTNQGLGKPSTFILNASAVNKPQANAITLTLIDASGTAFSPNSLPTALDLAKYSTATLGYDPPAGSFSGHITSLKQLGPAVPEPGSVVLMGIGLALVVGYRRRRVIVA